MALIKIERDPLTGSATPVTSLTEMPSPGEDRLLRRIQAEFKEMPGMSLTPAQAARLWAVEPHRVERFFARLAEDGFLIRNSRGAYLRRGCPRCS